MVRVLGDSQGNGEVNSVDINGAEESVEDKMQEEQADEHKMH